MSVAAVMHPASREADTLAAVIEATLWVCTGALALAMLALAGALLWRSRRPVADGVWIWGGGVVLPLLVFGGLLGWSMVKSEGLDEPPPPDALQVSVTGRMWWWDLHYGTDGPAAAFATANELRVPVGRPVRLTLASGDVIHSLWVPSLGGKMDAVPGRLNRLTFTAREPGVYRGPCAEYCGTQHAGMVLQVVAMAPEAFEAWRQAQTRPHASADKVGDNGSRLFQLHGCASCHSVRGHREAPAAEGLGPDLTHVGQRLWLGAGTLRQPGGREALKTWIADVHAAKPGARMPSFQHLPPQDIESLAAFLAEAP